VDASDQVEGLETIFALSSGQPPCAIAVIRLSGPGAFTAAERLTGMALPEPRRAVLRRFRCPDSSEVIDEGLVLRMDADSSITGEPLVELHCHGSRAVVRDLESVLRGSLGLRPAEAGEFTRRAFMNGRLDLGSVEGLGDLLAAETTLQRQTALAMMGGRLGQQIAEWSRALTTLAAQVEARLDFSDEGDVTAGDLLGVAAACTEIATAMRTTLDRPLAHRLRDGIRVAIGGPPNAGKSTLFNAMIGREAAIVSPHAGTTRDVIEASVAIGGIPFVIADSAGLRETVDEVERVGVDRATALIEGADIILWLGDPADRPSVSGRIIQLHPKADLGVAQLLPDEMAISARTGQGMDQLIDTLRKIGADLVPRPGDYALSLRQHACLSRAENAILEASAQADEILVAENLRQALSALDELTGRVTTEAVLDEVFSGFCIGK